MIEFLILAVGGVIWWVMLMDKGEERREKYLARYYRKR